MAMAKSGNDQRKKPHSFDGESAGIYCRISQASDDDQTGVDRQGTICHGISKNLGLVVDPAHVFIDNNRSAWKRDRKRPGWDAMLEAMRNKEFRHVIAYHPDRLMRQPRDLEELLQISDDLGITLHGQANRRDLSDPDDRFFLRIEVAHACRSSDDTSRRIRSFMEEQAAEGKPHTGKRRFGYAPGGMSLIKDEAEIVREVFNRYLNGETPNEITRDLNERGVKTPSGGAWSDTNLRSSILSSRHVAGIRVFRGEEVGQGSWPAIIDRGLWDEVQETRQTRAVAWSDTHAAPRFYLLRGVVECGRCHVRMAGSAAGAGTGAYVCNRRHRADAPGCKRRILAEPLEKFATAAAIKLLTELTPGGKVKSAVLNEADIKALEADRAQLAEFNDMLVNREITRPEYREMRRKVEERMAKIQSKAVVRPVQILEGVTGPGAAAAWGHKDMTDQRRNAIMRFLFSAVVINESSGKRGVFNYGRINIEQNEL